jgi:hypothetical protein
VYDSEAALEILHRDGGGNVVAVLAGVSAQGHAEIHAEIHTECPRPRGGNARRASSRARAALVSRVSLIEMRSPACRWKANHECPMLTECFSDTHGLRRMASDR